MRDGTIALEPTCPAVAASISRPGAAPGSGPRGRAAQASRAACGWTPSSRPTPAPRSGVVRSRVSPRTRACRRPAARTTCRSTRASPWPKFRRDRGADRPQPRSRPDRHRTALWRFQTGKGIFSTPVIDGDGNVYIGSADRTFYAIDRDGTVRWKLLDRRDHRLVRAARRSRPRLRRLGRRQALRARRRHRRRGVDLRGRPPQRSPAPSSTGSRATSRWAPTAPSTCRTTTSSPTPSIATPRRCAGASGPPTRPGRCPALDAATGRLFIGNNIQLLRRTPSRSTPATGEAIWQPARRRHRRREPAARPPTARWSSAASTASCAATTRRRAMPCWTFGARDHIYASPARAARRHHRPAVRRRHRLRARPRRPARSAGSSTPRDADPLVARRRRRRQHLRRLRRGPPLRAQPRRHAALVDAADRRPARRPQRVARARPRRRS